MAWSFRRYVISWFHVFVCLSFILATTAASLRAEDYQRIEIKAGESKEIWYGFNVKGSVNLAIRTKDGSNKVRLWWVKQPFGRVEQLGIVGPELELQIPGSRPAEHEPHTPPGRLRRLLSVSAPRTHRTTGRHGAVRRQSR